MSRVSVESVQRDHDEYRGVSSAPDEETRMVSADDVSLETLLEQ